MNPTERETDDYFEALAGRAPHGSGADALRDALLAEARTLREAEAARAEDLGVAERAEMDGIKRRLIAAGAFRASVPVQPPHPWTRWIGGLFKGLFDSNWQRPLAVAAGLVVATVIVLRLDPGLDADDPSTTLRGPAVSEIEAADAAARSAELERLLVQAGAEVVRVPIDDKRWALQVDVPDAAALPAVQALLREAGFRVEGTPPYELGIRTQP